MNGKVIAECRPHWSSFIDYWVLAFLFVAIGIISENTEVLPLCAALAMFFVGNIFISCKFTSIRLTETKIEGHMGFIKSKTLSTPLSKIQDISLSNGLWGKIFRYHTVSISSAGTAGTEYVFKRMAHAKEFVNAVELEAEKQK